MNPHGWVLLAEICTWPRMVLLGAANPFEVAKAIAGFSLALEVDTSYQFVRMRPNPVYIVPGPFHSMCPPHIFPGMHPLPPHPQHSAQLHIHSPQADFLQHPESAPSVSWAQHPVSSEHVVEPPNTIPFSVEHPDCLPIDTPRKPSGHSLPHLPMHRGILTAPQHADPRFICQQQVGRSCGSKNWSPTQPAIPTAAASEYIDQIKHHGPQQHPGRKETEATIVTADIHEAEKETTSLTSGIGQNHCARKLHDGPTQPTSELTYETEQVQCQPFHDTPFQQLHHIGISSKTPSPVCPSHSGTELEHLMDQNASPKYIVHVLPSISGCTAARSFRTNRAAFREAKPRNAIHHGTGFLDHKKSDLHMERLGSDVSSDDNGSPSCRSSTTNNRATSPSPAFGHLKCTAPRLHTGPGSARNSAQPFSQNKLSNPTHRRPYGRHSHPSQQHHCASTVRPKMPEQRPQQRSTKNIQRNRRNQCKRPVARTEGSLLCGSSFPPLSKAANTSLMGCRMKAIKSREYQTSTAGQVWAKKPVSVLHSTPASTRHGPKVGQRDVGPGLRP